ncbi:hypothetical protein [Falsiroseomonas sp. E2-1-a4]|uniref:hypothetical protein n=1 Tax=Falsiroseomonas sp. E2-1-a4 TaxID=3239299 RepID=UPI003F3D47C3
MRLALAVRARAGLTVQEIVKPRWRPHGVDTETLDCSAPFGNSGAGAAGECSGGQQQQLAIGRALSARPRC